jgi:hypothetical protein
VPGFIPIFIFLSAAIAVVVLQYVPKGTGIAWLISVLGSISAWVLVLVIKSRLPYSFSTSLFLNLGVESVLPAFQFDIINWPFVLSICGLVVGALMVSSARIGVDSNCWEWAGILLLGALGISGCLSANILTAVVILGLFDLVDVTIILLTGESKENINESLKNAVWRLISLVLFMTAFAWQMSQTGAADDWKTLLPGPGYVILAGCMLRMTLIPSTKITGNPRKSTNGLYVTRFIVGFLMSTALVIQLPFHSGESIWKNVLLIYLFIISLISTFMIIRNRENEQTLFWQIFAGSLVCAEYLYGFSAAGIFFTITAAVISQVLILNYPVSRYSKGIGFFALLGFSGLPFTPNNTGLAGFNWNGQIPGFLFLFPAIIAFFAFIRNLLNKTSKTNPDEERWAGFLSPTGLIFPIITPWIISLNWLPDRFVMNVSIQALIVSFAGTGLFLAELFHFMNIDALNARINSMTGIIKQRASVLTSKSNISFELDIQRPAHFLTELFEGDGGILWAILCLVLVITIIQSLGFS